MQRSAFLAGTAALCAAVRPVDAQTVDFRLSKADMEQIVETVRRTHVERVWKPASALPSWSPLALPRRRQYIDGDPAVVWINVDHLELMTPRTAHPSDEVPIVAATIGGLLDLKLDVAGWKHLAALLEQLPGQDRYPLITELGRLLVASYGVRTVAGVSDADFARAAFPFAVIRNMTPGVPGVDSDEPPAGMAMPQGAPMIAYMGRTDPRHPGVPVVWGDGKHAPANYTETADFLDRYIRAYILATADMEPAESAEKRAYDEARAVDERSGEGIFIARDAFAAPYEPRVRALVSH